MIYKISFILFIINELNINLNLHDFDQFKRHFASPFVKY